MGNNGNPCWREDRVIAGRSVLTFENIFPPQIFDKVVYNATDCAHEQDVSAKYGFSPWLHHTVVVWKDGGYRTM